MQYLPVFLDLDQRAVLVVGGSEKAAQKLRLLMRTQANIRVIAEQVTLEIVELVRSGAVAHVARAFHAADVLGQTIVFAATGDAARDRAVTDAANAAGVLVNVVDSPAQSRFIMPAIIDRNPVLVAIGTGGSAPILAREIKSRIEAWLPANFGAVARASVGLRDLIQKRIAAPHQRRHVFERLIKGDWRQKVLVGDSAGAATEAEREVLAEVSAIGRPGIVSLIGCGPGEPDLLTLKAQQRLQAADVLVIDRLVNPAILDYARRDAIRIDVGKDPHGTSFPQEEINRILVREALLGHNVARLKGGDAFVFGRAAEEMAAVRAAGATVEIIPGITAAHACAASVGLPLTQRGDIREFTVLTGATRDGVLDFDWAALARPGHAFAIYMGVGSASTFAAKLLAAGADDETPVVIVENGTRSTERSVATNLGLLARAVQETGIKGPAIIFVGLSWDAAYLTRPAKVEVFDGQPTATLDLVVKVGADVPAALSQVAKAWTPQEVALATFWVAG